MVDRHRRAGWWGLGVFIGLGLVLELLHAFKAPQYLDVGHETTRLFLRLAHAHGTLLSVINILYYLTARARPDIAHRAASVGILAALVLVPGGFLLGALWAHGGDPGLGALLVPLGALGLIGGAAMAGRAAKVDGWVP